MVFPMCKCCMCNTTASWCAVSFSPETVANPGGTWETVKFFTTRADCVHSKPVLNEKGNTLNVKSIKGICFFLVFLSSFFKISLPLLSQFPFP